MMARLRVEHQRLVSKLQAARWQAGKLARMAAVVQGTSAWRDGEQGKHGDSWQQGRQFLTKVIGEVANRTVVVSRVHKLSSLEQSVVAQLCGGHMHAAALLGAATPQLPDL